MVCLNSQKKMAELTKETVNEVLERLCRFLPKQRDVKIKSCTQDLEDVGWNNCQRKMANAIEEFRSKFNAG